MPPAPAALVVAIVGASVVLFFASAIVHGRQLRLEREAKGFMHVVFGGDNRPEVEALWRADRVRFWSLTAALVVVAGAACALVKPELPLALAAVSWAPSLAFLICGLLSYLRRAA